MAEIREEAHGLVRGPVVARNVALSKTAVEGLPDDTPVVIDVRSGDEYVRVEDIDITAEEDAVGGRTPTGVQLATRRVQRDAPQQELGELRSALCHTLGKSHREPGGPQGLTIISVLSDREIFSEIGSLRAVIRGRSWSLAGSSPPSSRLVHPRMGPICKQVLVNSKCSAPSLPPRRFR